MPASINGHPNQDVAKAPCTMTCDPEARPDLESPPSANPGNLPLSGTSWDNDAGSSGAVPGPDLERLDDNDPGSTKLSVPSSTEESPNVWTWAFRKLRQTVIEAKGAATEEAIKFMMKHLRGTKLILVVGQARAGKTTILSELTGLPGLVSGDILARGNEQYRIYPTIIDDEQYLFINTTDFGSPYYDNFEPFQNLMSCMTTIGAFAEVVGVLFVIGRVESRLHEQDVKMIHWLQCFSGPDFLPNVTIVTSFWDDFSRYGFRQAYSQINSLHEGKIFKEVLHPSLPGYTGATIYHHGLAGGEPTPDFSLALDLENDRGQRSEELRNLIRRRYANRKFNPVKLQLMKELENGIDLLETEAAKVLRVSSFGTDVGIRAGKCFVWPDLKSREDLNMLDLRPVPRVDPESETKRLYEWYELAQKLATYFYARHQADSALAFVQVTWNDILAWRSRPPNRW